MGGNAPPDPEREGVLIPARARRLPGTRLQRPFRSFPGGSESAGLKPRLGEGVLQDVAAALELQHANADDRLLQEQIRKAKGGP